MQRLIYLQILKLTLVCSALLCTTSILGQSVKALKKQAAVYMKAGQYQKALRSYQKLAAMQPQNQELQFELGKCYYHLSQNQQALRHFQVYLQDKQHKDEALLYTARAMHRSGRYREAPRFYKLYLKVSQLSKEERFGLKKELLQCVSAAKRGKKKAPVVVVPLGQELNSSADELLSLSNPQYADQIFFSSNRGGDFQIYKSQQAQGQWQTPELIPDRYNSSNDERLLAFPDVGYQILYQRNEAGKSIVRIDNYILAAEDTTALDVPFPLGIPFSNWIGDHYFFSDSLVLFSAEVDGQKDLYYLQKDSAGYWLAPQALSPSINSPFNERSPFLAKDGRSLYFSSDHPNSMGGYDVYLAFFNDTTGQWSSPQPLEVPINSAGDDLFFRLQADGLKGFLSSFRDGGEGGLDLYSLYFRQYQQKQLLTSTPSSFVELLALQPYTKSTNANPDTLVNQLTLARSDTSNRYKSLYRISPLYYDGNSGELLVGSEKVIRTLQNLLTRYPEVRVLLTSHTDDLQPLTSNLFLSVQQAQLIAQQLLDAGVKPNQIYLRGCAQQYPIAQNYNFDGSPNNTGRKLNQRIDIHIFNSNHLPITIEIKSPMVSSIMQSPLAAQYQEELEGLCYKVHLLQTANLFNHEIIGSIQHIHTEKLTEKPEISYTIGLAKQFNAIRHILETAQQMGFTEASIVPYFNGWPVKAEEAYSLMEHYPDLKAYVAYLEKQD